MRSFRFLLLSALAAVALIALAACGDDEERLTDEEYFAELTELDKDFDERGEALFGDDEAGAKAYSDLFREAAQTYDEALNDLNPPADLQEEHDDLVDAIQTFRSAVEAVDFEEDAPAEEFFENEDLAEPFAAVDAPFCALQAIADDKGIDASVGCEEEDAGPDPSTLEPVETNEVLIEDFEFEPPHIQVAAGDRVIWMQGADEAPHTATSDDDVFDSGNLEAEGEAFEFTFDEAGAYPYSCEIHPDMKGLVTVTE